MPRPAPLLKTEPVTLADPPDAAAPRPPSLAGRAVLLVLLMLGVPFLGLVLTAGLIALNLILYLRLERAYGALFLAALAVPFALSKALLAVLRKPPESPDEVEVPASEEPGVHAEARRLAEMARTRPPDRIVVVADVNAYVHETGPLLGLLGTTRTLAIGVPLLDALTVSELRSVLGHELGHFASGDTRLGPLAYRTEVALVEILRSLRGVSHAIFFAYYKLQYRLGAVIRQAQEVVADQAAVRIAGRQAAADALRKVELAALLDELHMNAYLVPLLEAGSRPEDLASGYRAVLGDKARVAWAEALPLDAERDRYASHPPIAERIRRIQALPEQVDPVAEVDGRAASALFVDPERWVRAAHERWLVVRAEGRSLATVDWEKWGDLVLQPEQEGLAADVDRALTTLGLPPGVAGIRAAVEAGRDRELGALLVSQGWRAGMQGTANDLLFGALLATASTELVRLGTHRWALSWSDRAELRSTDGENVHIHERVAEAVHADWSRLDELLSGRRTRRSRSKVDAAGETSAVVGTPPVDSFPVPPVPPFEAVDEGTWRVRLTNAVRVKGKVELTATASALAIGGRTVAWDEVVHMRLESVAGPGNLGCKLTVTTADGAKHVFNVAAWSKKEKGAVAATADYLWEAFTRLVAPRRSAEIADELRAGGSVAIGKVTLTAEGVAKRRRQPVPWVQVAGPIDVGPEFIGFALAEDGMATSVSEEDAYLLPTLLPYLRALFA